MKTVIPDRAHLELNVADVHSSAANPRQAANEEALEALTESVRACGILQPIVVRRVADDKGFEVICGHRRLAAAIRAGLEVVPAIVRLVDDAEAFDMAMAENLQRQDLTEIDEAEAYRAWQERGQTGAEIALKVGRSVAHVYGRLKLLELPDAAKDAIKSGQMTVAVGILIGRIPGQAQREEATEALLTRYGWQDDDDDDVGDRQPIPFGPAASLIRTRFMTALETAPFDVNDSELVPSVGACGACPHRTGNQVDLFGDVLARADGGTDVCTYPPCFNEKRRAFAATALERAQADGLETLNEKQLAKAFDRYGNLSGSWVNADSTNDWRTHGKTWRAALGKKAPPEFAVVNLEGDLVRVYSAKAACAVLEEKRAKAAEKLDKKIQQALGQERSEWLRSKDVDAQAERDLATTVFERAGSAQMRDPKGLLKLIAAHLYLDDMGYDARDRRDASDTDDAEHLIYLDTLDTDGLLGLICEIAFEDTLGRVMIEDGPEDWDEMVGEIEELFEFRVQDVREQAATKVDSRYAAEAAAAALAAEAPPAADPTETPKKKARAKK